jgi:wyosine [tRNA(Phe)-imidazoG37] synthetase (radical SAM superfamily)
MQFEDPAKSLRSLHASHPRHWRDNLYVYPVISRRAGGLSIGVNLNPDKACNFDCVYCQVDRRVPSVVRRVDLERLRQELEATLQSARCGDSFTDPPFSHVPESERGIRDIAFSGDGEPTLAPEFPEAVQLAADLRQRLGLVQTKIVLITNAVYLDRPSVRDALAVMDANNGEIWAKLDAGTEEYHQRVNRPNVSLQQVLDNILEAARVRPIVIQSLWASLRGQPPPESEVESFAQRLASISEGGGQIRLVQVYTVARRPAEPFVEPLTNDTLNLIAQRIRDLARLPVEVYGC